MTNDDAPTARMAGRFLTGWRRALGELAIVSLGVLLALWADQAMQARQEDARAIGYLERLQAQLVAMESVSRPEAGRSLLATFVVESGKPGPVRA